MSLSMAFGDGQASEISSVSVDYWLGSFLQFLPPMAKESVHD